MNIIKGIFDCADLLVSKTAAPQHRPLYGLMTLTLKDLLSSESGFPWQHRQEPPTDDRLLT